MVLAGVIALAILFLGFGTWAATARIAGAIVVPARITPTAPPHQVQSTRAGVISEVRAEDGQVVRAGDVLISLDADALRSDLQVAEAQLVNALAEQARWRAERDDLGEIAVSPELQHAEDEIRGQNALLQARRARLAAAALLSEQSAALIRARMVGLEAQQRALGQQKSLIDQEARSQQALLDLGLAQAARVIALKRETARLDGQEGAISAELAQAEAQRAGLYAEEISQAAARREAAIAALRELAPRVSALRARRDALRLRVDLSVIRAPIAGIIHNLQPIAASSVVTLGAPLLEIVPRSASWNIEARISPGQIDRVSPGQQVVLRFPGLDASSTPDIAGIVARLSADVLTDEITGAPYFKAILTPGSDADTLRPEGGVSISGMPVEAYIRTHDHTPLRYLSKPVTDYLKRSLRE